MKGCARIVAIDSNPHCHYHPALSHTCACMLSSNVARMLCGLPAYTFKDEEMREEGGKGGKRGKSGKPAKNPDYTARKNTTDQSYYVQRCM